ncbi:hypothetical protein SHO565_14700 [Streptomyces sp. HO565]
MGVEAVVHVVPEAPRGVFRRSVLQVAVAVGRGKRVVLAVPVVQFGDLREGGGGERDPVDVPVVAEQLGQSLGDGGDGLDRGLPGEAGFPVRLVVSEGPPVAVGMPGVEVDEQAAVGAVDADASACAIVLARPAEEVDQRADRIGEPVDARSRQLARGDQDPVLGREGPHRRALYRRRQWARTDRVQRVGAGVQETSGTRAGGASYPSTRARGGSGCWARLCEVMGCCGLRWVS